MRIYRLIIVRWIAFTTAGHLAVKLDVTARPIGRSAHHRVVCSIHNFCFFFFQLITIQMSIDWRSAVTSRLGLLILPSEEHAAQELLWCAQLFSFFFASSYLQCDTNLSLINDIIINSIAAFDVIGAYRPSPPPHSPQPLTTRFFSRFVEMLLLK